MPKSRGQKTKTVKSKIYIFCEGEKTEFSYLTSYRNRFASTNRLVEIIVKSGKYNTPEELVEEVLRVKKNEQLIRSPNYYWVVYDRESESQFPNNYHERVYNKAKKHNISVAMSNVCFEYWLLLHVRKVNFPCNLCDDVIHHSQFIDAMQSIGIIDYNKGKHAGSMNKFIELNTIARSNADRINQTTKATAPEGDADKPYKLNPYTDVYKLLDAIDEIASGMY